MATLYPKKRIEIVIEQIRANDAIEMLENAGAKGYTILRKVSGKDNRGIRVGGPLPYIFGNVMIIAIVSDHMATKILNKAHLLFEDVAGIVAVSDMQALRSEHF